MSKKKSRKVLLFTLAVIMTLAAFSFTVFAEGATPPIDGSGYIIMQVDSKYMNVNGVTVEVDPGRDTAPIIVDNRTMIPARALTEAMGGTVGWDQDTHNVALSANGNTALMTLNQYDYTVNGVSNVMDVAPVIKNERTLIPLRFAGEALGCNVEWFADTKEILVTFALSVKQQYSGGLDDRGFWIGIKALDYVKIADVHAMKIPSDVHQISDDTLKSEIQNILSNYASTVQIKNRSIKNGDTVNIDFVGSIDGVEFNGGSTGGMGTDVIIGETQYIDNFLDQLIGHKPGETVKVRVTFPNDYSEVTLKGKAALFLTTINYIIEQIAPELTDDFVAANLSANYGWKTVKEMSDDIRANLQKQSIEQYITEYLSTMITISSVPDLMMEYQERAMLNYFREYADYYSIDELIDTYYDINLSNATLCLVVQAIAEDAGISVSTADLEAYFLNFSGSADYSLYEEDYGLPYVMNTVLHQKVFDYIVKNAIRL